MRSVLNAGQLSRSALNSAIASRADFREVCWQGQSIVRIGAVILAEKSRSQTSTVLWPNSGNKSKIRRVFEVSTDCIRRRATLAAV
jgi:hypothetical protein